MRIFYPIINFNSRMQLKEAERFEEYIVELVVEEAEMAAQHLVEVEDVDEEEMWEEEEDMVEEEQALWEGEEDVVEGEQESCDEEDDPYEMEEVGWLEQYEDYAYLLGLSSFQMMEDEALRLVEEAIEEIAEEWEED